MKNDFETYWQAHRQQLLRANEEYRRVEESYKMKSGADWLLFGIPVVAGIAFMGFCPVQSELLKWLLSALVTIACFALCVWIKSAASGERSLDEIEREVKSAAFEAWESQEKK